MKKIIKRPDGSEELIEGTAEEIAEYERKLREVVKPGKGKKPVLHGAEVDGTPLTDDEVMMVRLKRMGILPQKEVSPPVYIPQIVPYHLRDIHEVKCWICGQYNCYQNHIWCGDTLTGTTITLNTDNTGGSNLLLQEAVDNALAVFDRINKTPSS